VKKEGIISEKFGKPIGIYSHATKVTGVNTLLFISGMTARDEKGEIVGKGDIKVQTQKVLENMKAILEQERATFDNIVKVTVYVTALEGFDQIQEVRAKFFKEPYPSSTLAQVSSLAVEGALIEMEAIAVLE
jgi:2-iminobutanoate/2-iminopropanoate deaminase